MPDYHFCQWQVMRICKWIDTKNGYEWLSLSYIIKEIENNFPVVSLQL